MISILLDHLGKKIKILEEPIVMDLYIQSQNIGKIWQNQYFQVVGIFVESIQIVNIEEQFMEHTYQVFTHQNTSMMK